MNQDLKMFMLWGTKLERHTTLILIVVVELTDSQNGASFLLPHPCSWSSGRRFELRVMTLSNALGANDGGQSLIQVKRRGRFRCLDSDLTRGRRVSVA